MGLNSRRFIGAVAWLVILPRIAGANQGYDVLNPTGLTTNDWGSSTTATQPYQYLTTGSDHLPAVADYTIPVSAPASLQSIQTVFVIPMENQNWSSIRGSSSAPYINNTLLPMASHAEQYYNPPGNHPSLPNYFWLEAGTNFGILADGNPGTPNNFHQSTTNHLVTLLKNAGISWRSYDEDICGCLCPLVNTNNYAVRHNPFVYFDDVTNTNSANSANCIAHDVAYSTLAGDLQNNTVARYNWVVPNLCDDMHNSCSPTNNRILQGDGWLSRELPKILNSQAYSNNGAVFIVWDEGASSSDGPIGMIVISPLAKGGGYSNTVHYTHSSTLKTLQEIFNVGPLLGDAGNATDLADLFNFGASPAQLVVSPVSRDFGSVISGQTNSLPFSVINTGGSSLTGTATVSGPFAVSAGGSYTVGAGQTQTVTASFTPVSGGAFTNAVAFNSNGGNSTNTVTGVGIVPPVAGFTASPTSGTEPLGVTFADTSTGTSPISLSWDLGDTTMTNTTGGAIFAHTYAAGTYSVTLTASNAAGISTLVSNNLISVITALQTWQLQYFGCTNCPQAAPDADPFGKGISNTNQFLMGLNPTNPASVFRIISVSPSGNDMVVTWQTSGGDPSGLFGSGKTNVLEAAPGQPDGSYSNNFASTGAPVVITTLGDVITNAVDSGGATNVPSWYYRIRFLSP